MLQNGGVLHIDRTVVMCYRAMINDNRSSGRLKSKYPAVTKYCVVPAGMLEVWLDAV